MSEKVTAMIEEIKGLTVLELSELVHALEEEFGVSAAAMAAPAAGAAALRIAGRTFACGAGSPADHKTQREACKKIPLGTAAACTADRCRLRGIADRRQLSVCRLACHAAV